MSETYTHEELKEKVRTGWQLMPDTPGLDEAARDVIRPLVEGMKGQKIIYDCRVSRLLRVDELTVDDKGFRAVATRLCRYRHFVPEMEEMAVVCDEREAAFGLKPFEFYASWSLLHLCGKGIKMAMVTDCFITDQEVVAAVETMAEGGGTPMEIYDIIARATRPEE